MYEAMNSAFGWRLFAPEYFAGKFGWPCPMAVDLAAETTSGRRSDESTSVAGVSAACAVLATATTAVAKV